MLVSYSHTPMPELSIIIITRNRKEKLIRAIESVKIYADIPYEIIVIDNGSHDGTTSELQKDQTLRCILNKTNRGVAASRNQGLREARGIYGMYLDDDASLTREGSLKEACEYIRTHHDVLLLGPKLIYPNGTIQESARPFPTLFSYLWRATRLDMVFPHAPWHEKVIFKNESPQEPLFVDWVIGACQLFPLHIQDSIGQLSEFSKFGYEDIAWARDIHALGKKVCYFPKLTVVHEYAQTSRKKPFSKDGFEHIKSIFHYFLKRK